MKLVKRFNKRVILALVSGIVFLLTACGNEDVSSIRGEEKTPAPAASPKTAETIDTEETGEETLQQIEVLVGDTAYTAQLADTEAASQLLEQLPLELEMQELNGNEKYAYLSQSLTADASRPVSIHAGDLMLFGSDCLVLFYEDFSTSYSYTPVGKLEKPEGLSQVLGSGAVTVTFRALS